MSAIAISLRGLRQFMLPLAVLTDSCFVPRGHAPAVYAFALGGPSAQGAVDDVLMYGRLWRAQP